MPTVHVFIDGENDPLVVSHPNNKILLEMIEVLEKHAGIDRVVPIDDRISGDSSPLTGVAEKVNKVIDEERGGGR